MLYSYKCKSCGEIFDIKATLEEKEKNSNEIFRCQKCESSDVVQFFGGVNIACGKSTPKGGGGCHHGSCGCGF